MIEYDQARLACRQCVNIGIAARKRNAGVQNFTHGIHLLMASSIARWVFSYDPENNADPACYFTLQCGSNRFGRFIRPRNENTDSLPQQIPAVQFPQYTLDGYLCWRCDYPQHKTQPGDTVNGNVMSPAVRVRFLDIRFLNTVPSTVTAPVLKSMSTVCPSVAIMRLITASLKNCPSETPLYLHSAERARG